MVVAEVEAGLATLTTLTTTGRSNSLEVDDDRRLADKCHHFMTVSRRSGIGVDKDLVG